MSDLRKAAEDLLEVVEAAIKAGDWRVDGACDPDSAIRALRQALAQPVDAAIVAEVGIWGEKPPVKTYCGGKPNYCTPVDAVNMSQECVDETAKVKYMDMSQVPTGIPNWKPGMVFPKPKREWVGLTDEEIIKCFDSVAFGQVEDDLIINKHVNIFTAIRGIEAKLKEKNT